MSADDSTTERIRAVLYGQFAPEAADGGRRLLLQCPQCHQPWYQDGPRSYPRLEPEQLARLTEELEADVTNLPYATCTICGAQALGELTMDSYGINAGFGISWEGVTPPGAHLLGSAIRLDWLERHAGTSNGRAQVVTDFVACRGFLDWLAHVRSPLSYQTMDQRGSDAMAQMNKPGHGVPGTDDWIWKGATWQESIRVLGGRCNISLVMALPAAEPLNLSLLLATWRELAATIARGHITGESEPPKPLTGDSSV